MVLSAPEVAVGSGAAVQEEALTQLGTAAGRVVAQMNLDFEGTGLTEGSLVGLMMVFGSGFEEFGWK
jgi:hypothetical protein